MMLTVKSPAKINLFLRVLGRRSDGYHELASLFQAIDLFDELHVKIAAEDRLTCSHPSLPTDCSNLVMKAVHLFRARTGIKTAFKIHLHKRIPIEAGLGGGSSNGATTLWAVNQLCGAPVPLKTLREWSSAIGSDLPFFFSNGTAYCTGRGENVVSLAPLPAQQVCIVKPLGGLPTPQVFKQLNPAVLLQRNPLDYLPLALQGEHCCFNDLEAPAFELMPELATLKALLLQRGFSSVLMSGAGSSFFCLGNGQMEPQPGLALYSARFTQRCENHWYF